MFLSDLKIGQKAKIVDIHAPERLLLRIMQMGFTPGAVVQVKESAPFGGPVSVIVRGALLSLRKSEARQIVVIHVEQ